MISRRVISAARTARPLPRPLFVRGFADLNEGKESPTQPFNHTEQKSPVDEKTTEKAHNISTTLMLGALFIGLPVSIYFGDWMGLTPKANKPGPASPLRKD
jgi:hypothetical protein